MNKVKMKVNEHIGRFMEGRYGIDPLSVAIIAASMCISVINVITRNAIALALAYVLLGWCAYRLLSKNIPARTKENEWFLSRTRPFVTSAKQGYVRFQNRKVYRYFTCPQCRQKLRVPRGKGNVTITCAKCGNKLNGKA